MRQAVFHTLMIVLHSLNYCDLVTLEGCQALLIGLRNLLDFLIYGLESLLTRLVQIRCSLLPILSIRLFLDTGVGEPC